MDSLPKPLKHTLKV